MHFFQGKVCLCERERTSPKLKILFQNKWKKKKKKHVFIFILSFYFYLYICIDGFILVCLKKLIITCFLFLTKLEDGLEQKNQAEFLGCFHTCCLGICLGLVKAVVQDCF